MRVIKFRMDKHFDDLVAMLKARNAYIPTKAEMPKIGYVAYELHTPLAAVFLRRVEGGYGQIDGLTSNPFASSSIRHEAIDAAVSSLLMRAKKLNVNKVMMTSEDLGTITRSQKYGFAKSPLAVMVADLSNWSV